MKDLRLALLTTAALIIATPAIAQTASPAANGQEAQATAQQDSTTGLEDIIVTAERRSSSVQRTPLAITALSADELANSNVTSSSGLGEVVAGVSAYEGGGFSQIRIRGIGGGVGNAYGEPGVAYNLGGAYLAQPYGGNSAYYDLDRVEVVKGPQGTLY